MALRSERSFQIGFRIDPETHERLVRAAAYTHRSVANYARHVLIERLTGERAVGINELAGPDVDERNY